MVKKYQHTVEFEQDRKSGDRAGSAHGAEPVLVDGGGGREDAPLHEFPDGFPGSRPPAPC